MRVLLVNMISGSWNLRIWTRTFAPTCLDTTRLVRNLASIRIVPLHQGKINPSEWPDHPVLYLEDLGALNNSRSDHTFSFISSRVSVEVDTVRDDLVSKYKDVGEISFLLTYYPF